MRYRCCKTVSLTIVLILLLASMSSCISKNSYREGEDGYTITVEEYMRNNPKIIAKYGDKFKLYEKSSGEGGELDYAGLSGSSCSTVLVNDIDMYGVTCSKKKNTSWYTQGGISLMKKYRCEEMECEICWNDSVERNCRIRINNQMHFFKAVLQGGGSFAFKIYDPFYENETTQVRGRGKFKGDIDIFTVKLRDKYRDELGLSSNILTFRAIEEDSGENLAESYIKDNPKLNSKYGKGYGFKKIKVEYGAALYDGKFIDRKVITYEINDKDKYKVFLFKKEGENWKVRGGICISSKYISDDGRIQFKGFESYENNGEMEYKGKKKKIQVSLEEGSNINELYKICILIDNTNESDGKSMEYAGEYSLDEFTVTLADSEDKYFDENFKTIHFHEVAE